MRNKRRIKKINERILKIESELTLSRLKKIRNLEKNSLAIFSLVT